MNMTLKTVEQRLHYIDHLRGFMFIVMAIDHCLHAYALNWGRFHFFKDENRTVIFDALYLHDQAIIMPMLFFIFGMFVIPSLQRRGLSGYLKERFFRLGIIYVIGVIFFVPLLSYPRYEYNEDPGISFWEFWRYVFFQEKLQAGPMWVIHAILAFTLLVLAIYYLLPSLYRGISRFFNWCVNNHLWGFLTFGLFSSTVLFISDILWGAPWWFNFGGIFSLQSSRMILITTYFLAGSVLMNSGVLSNNEFMTKFADQWTKFLAIYLVLAVGFMLYTPSDHNFVYNEEVRRFAMQNGGWFAAESGMWPVFQQFAPPILLRTFLHGFMCLSQVILLLAIFKKFFDQPTPMWTSLARNAFGIFLIHDPIVVWLQYYMNNQPLPIAVKFLVCVVVGISLAWLISAKIILKIPFIERILSPKPKGVQ